MSEGNKWDLVSEQFNTYKDDIWYGADDNIKTVWPIFLDYIKQNFPSPQALKALEFGCGTGMFCRELKSLGFDVTGMDVSPEMIKVGKENLPSDIRLLVGGVHDAKKLSENGNFNLITAIMVLQFIEAKDLSELADCLPSGGHLIFACHNPRQLEVRGVTDALTLGDTGVTVTIYKREAKEYDDIFLSMGFKKTLETYAESVPEIKAQYKITNPKDVRKYIILAYQKN